MATVDERMLASTGNRRSFLFLRAPPPPESLVLSTDDLVEETDDDVMGKSTNVHIYMYICILPPLHVI